MQKIQTRSRTTALALVLLLALACWSGCMRTAEPARDFTFRVMTYNIHHGEGMDGQVDLQRIADVIKESRAEIVALQEVDRGTERTSRRDFPAELAVLTGMTCVFSNNHHFQGGEYGNAVLTRFPVKQALNHHLRALQPKEQRGLQELVLDLNGRELVLLNTHLDAGRNDVERWSSVEEIEQRVKTHAQRPLLICGDFNATPESRVARKLAEFLEDTWLVAGEGDGFTVPSTAARRRIDYIWMSRHPDLTPLTATVPKTEASDHLPLVVEFR